MDWNLMSTELWDDEAKNWGKRENKAKAWERGPRKAMIDFLFDYIGQPPGTVLDFGCGTGESTKIMMERGYDSIGTDQSTKMVKTAMQKGVQAKDMKNNTLPFSNESFDSIFACTSLEWTNRPSELISEVSRVLKQGGKIVAVTLGPSARPRWSAYKRLYGEQVIHNMMMPWELKALLEDHGLECTRMAGAQSGNKPLVDQETYELLSENWIAQASISFLWGIGAVKK
ncbi:class I SAM-dependent methyltransferase [Pseudalkalibacillus caeni]|uniref:Class I SAM-dependent methyltransferase n=1 Tax=Exobacillus caeni TaxID=2574798 RepID=A0A5R9FCJ4_9BACL|nr:class I SAM-dependent methyltransferase [Pseudalkalibacillus caeni]TLS38274.1 class I SAM-dependent methyltransferase [Pseudalkalibacillus caeni]